MDNPFSESFSPVTPCSKTLSPKLNEGYNTGCVSQTCLSKEDVNHQDVTHILKNIRMSNLDKVVIGQLNVNSLSEKFHSLKFIIPENIDIMIIEESKFDESYPSSQFMMEGFAESFRCEHNANGGGHSM